MRIAIATGPEGAPALADLAHGLVALGHQTGGDGDDAVLFDAAAPPDEVARLACRARVAAVVRDNGEAAPGEAVLPLSVPLVCFSAPADAETVAAALEEALRDRRLVTPSADGRMEADLRARFTAPVTLPDRAPGPAPTSIVVLSFDQVRYTQACVASIRAHTPEPHEVVMVDNGSAPEVVAWVRRHADVAVLNPSNRGVAAGLNQGARAASGEVLVFLNNDTRVPAGWLPSLHQALAAGDDVGMVSASVTAGTAIHRRRVPGTGVRELFQFSDYIPAGVCMALRREALDAVGGWRETSDLVASEDYELCFALWSLGYRVLIDERVLVEHACEGTSAAKLADWKATYTEAGRRFLERWRAGDAPAAQCFPGGPWRAARHALDAGDLSGARAALAYAEAAALADRRRQARVVADLMVRRDPARPPSPWSA
jgi:GT2 family glycosyltransferase